MLVDVVAAGLTHGFAAAAPAVAERTVIDRRRTIDLPADVDAVKVATGMNPAMSSWVTLHRTVPIQPGQSVLVLGATGNAGAMAVQVAKHLGDGRAIGAGRDRVRLGGARPVRRRREGDRTSLGPSQSMSLTLPLGEVAHSMCRAVSSTTRSMSRGRNQHR